MVAGLGRGGIMGETWPVVRMTESHQQRSSHLLLLFLWLFHFSQSAAVSCNQPRREVGPAIILLCLSDDGVRKPVCSVTLLQVALATTARPNAQRQHIRASEIWEGEEEGQQQGGE